MQTVKSVILPFPMPRRAWILASLVATGAALRILSWGDDPRTPDEMVYTGWAAMLARGDAHHRSVADLVADYNAQRSVTWDGPSPLRVGYLELLSTCMRGDRPQNIQTGVVLSTAFSILNLALLAWLGWKAMGFEAAALGLLLMTSSPLDLLVARRCWQDAVIANAVILALWALHAASERASPQRLAAAFAASLWLLLLKESGIVLFGILCAPVVWRRSWKALGAAAAAVPAAAVLLAALAGGPRPAWDAWCHCWAQAVGPARADSGAPQAVDFDGIPMVVDPEGARRGAWHEALLGMGALSPWALVLGLAGAVLALRSRDRTIGPVAWFALASLAIATARPLSLRLLAPADLPLHALAGLAIVRFLGMRPAAWMLCAALAGADLANARILAARGVADPLPHRVVAASLYTGYHRAP